MGLLISLYCMNKSKMIKFCREKIIMANNLECKTYEEALEKEYDYNDLKLYKLLMNIKQEKDNEINSDI